MIRGRLRKHPVGVGTRHIRVGEPAYKALKALQERLKLSGPSNTRGLWTM